jgi:hypothetical protein
MCMWLALLLFWDFFVCKREFYSFKTMNEWGFDVDVEGVSLHSLLFFLRWLNSVCF